MINQQMIKSINKKNVYRLISENPDISRSTLARQMKLSKATISSLVDELIQEGYIIDKGIINTSLQGRKPNSLMVNEDKNSIIAINLTRKTIQVAEVSVGYEIKKHQEYAINNRLINADLIEKVISKFIMEHISKTNILGICLIVPGIVDAQNQNIFSLVLNLDENEEIISKLRTKLNTNYALAIFNDTACLAYADNSIDKIKTKFYLNHLEKNEINYVFLNINEGVGASYIQNGKILRGATGMGTQFGHVSIDKNGKRCRCGNKGCLENYIGEIALNERLKEKEISKKIRDKENIRFKDVEELAQLGDLTAIQFIHELASDLSFALANLIAILHPDKIVIGGSGKKLGKEYLSYLKKIIGDLGFKKFTKDIEISFSKLDEDSIFIGAAKYYMDTHYDFMADMKTKLILG